MNLRLGPKQISQMPVFKVIDILAYQSGHPDPTKLNSNKYLIDRYGNVYYETDPHGVDMNGTIRITRAPSNYEARNIDGLQEQKDSNPR